MNSADMVARARVDARAIGDACKTPGPRIGAKTQQHAINETLHMMQLRQAGIISRDTELVYGSGPLSF